MKQLIYPIIAICLLLAACKADEPAVNNRSVEEIKAAMNDAENPMRVYSYKEIIETFTSEAGAYQPVRTRSDGPYAEHLFTIDTIAYDQNGDGVYNDKDAIYFLCRVISDDYTGNVYKNLLVQDVLDPKYGVTIALDASSIGGFYPLGQVLLVRLNGLAIGKYANKYELGTAAYYSRTTETSKNAAQKVGWYVGRIPFNRFQRWTERIGVADPSKIVVTDMTIPQMRAEETSDLQALCGRMVRIKDVHFSSEYYDKNGNIASCTDNNPREDQYSAVFAPTTDFQNFSQGRIFKDDSGNALSVSTSEFSKFAYYRLPASDYVGNVVGIVTYYYDNANFKPNNAKLAITLRGIGVDGSINDLQDFRNDDGELWVPKEWSAAE